MADDTITSQIPPEIQFYHILPRLPARSLIRFQCVSKQWHSFIKSPKFMKMYLHHITTEDHRQNHHTKLLVIPKPTPTRSEFCTIDCEAPENGISLGRPFPFEEEAIGKHVRILTSFHGLLCVVLENLEYQIILWNPLTGEHKTLPKPNNAGYRSRDRYSHVGRSFHLYYNSYEDDYKLLRVSYGRNVYIYSLKSDSWRKVKPHDKNIESWGPGVLLDENLYFFTQEVGYTWRTSITTFDIKTEGFKEIPTPPIRDGAKVDWKRLTVLRGCVHLYILHCSKLPYNVCNHVIELWRMNGEGDWMNTGSYCLMQSSLWIYEPLNFMKNGNLLIDCGSKDHLCILDLEKHVEDEYPCACAGNIDSDWIQAECKYIETLVSPNRYIK